ncbi:MAG: triose-phosphate isomerase [Candidatus Sumerlaeota bacterium]|nr:triose-phosphate isomerase [Candidatus Sumerlaeota bacterium]
MRIAFIAGNWKLNKTRPEARALVEALKPLVANAKAEVAVCPPFTALETVGALLTGSNIRLGAQNCCHEPSGAFTGEVSPPMLKDLGCDYCIVGHSERRQYFGETDEGVNKKAKALLAAGIKPILCVGETLAQREANETEKVVERQVCGAYAGLSAADALQTVVAYEPVWAIGTGRNATPQQAQDAHKFIRGLLAKLYDQATAGAVRIQYGGSMKPSNAAELLSQPDVDGGLIGGASLKAEDFAGIVNAAP